MNDTNKILSELRMNSKKLEAVVLYSSSRASTYGKTSEEAGVFSCSILEEIKELHKNLVGNYLVRAEFLKDNFSIALNLIVSSDDSPVDIRSPRYLIQFSVHNIETEHLEKILMFADDAGIKELKMLPLLLKHACQYHGKLCFLFGGDMFLKGRNVPTIAGAEFFASEKVLGRNLIAGDFSNIPFDVVISSFSHITLEDKGSLMGEWFADFCLVHVHGQTVYVCSSAGISKARSLFGHAFIVVGLHVAEVVKAMKGEKALFTIFVLGSDSMEVVAVDSFAGEQPTDVYMDIALNKLCEGATTHMYRHSRDLKLGWRD